jgi:hypothetical protein
MLKRLAGLVKSIERLTVGVGRASPWCALAVVPGLATWLPPVLYGA